MIKGKEEEPAAKKCEGKEKKRLLIIDDSRIYRMTLRLLFQEDYAIWEAADGQQGFALAQKEHPDVILCDVVMPFEDGYSCCLSLKGHVQTHRIPIIMLTSKNDRADILTGLKLGIDDYIVKPCDPRILKLKVDNLVKNRELVKDFYAEPVEPATEAPSRFMRQAVRLIEQHIAEPAFGVKQLAEFLFVSPTSLYRKIMDGCHFSPSVLIRNIRMEKAGEFLKTQAFSVIEVAELVGYNDVSSFRKHFTDYFGKTPLAYGKK